MSRFDQCGSTAQADLCGAVRGQAEANIIAMELSSFPANQGANFACILTFLFLSACASPLTRNANSRSEMDGNARIVFSAETAIQDQWLHLPLRGTTDYRLAAIDGRIAIRAEANRSASGLIRFYEVDLEDCQELQWLWRVEAVQSSADLESKEKEDVAASLFLLFGDPGLLSNPTPVPTLRYVWTNDRLPKETVVDNPYMPGVVRSIVVQSGAENAHQWISERRNVLQDYKRAFGKTPESPIHAVVIFTDNDQTHEAAVAYYGWAKFICDAA